MEAVGIAILLVCATFVCCGFINYTKSCKHQWGKWSNPLIQETRTSFNSASKAYQVRVCATCNESESRTISEVRA